MIHTYTTDRQTCTLYIIYKHTHMYYIYIHVHTHSCYHISSSHLTPVSLHLADILTTVFEFKYWKHHTEDVSHNLPNVLLSKTFALSPNHSSSEMNTFQTHWRSLCGVNCQRAPSPYVIGYTGFASLPTQYNDLQFDVYFAYLSLFWCLFQAVSRQSLLEALKSWGS